jgi:hypothetical protein
LKAAGVDPADLRTTNLNVHDFFDQGKQKVTARVASYQLEITIRQLDQLGEHLAGLVSVAGDSLQIHGLQLAIGDPEPLKREARLQAMNDARNKATQLANAAGGHLGQIVSVEEGSPMTDIPYRGFATRAASLPHVQIEPGSLTVTCRVAVAYELSEKS